MNIKNHNQQNCAKLSDTILPERYNVRKSFFTILYSLCLALSLISLIWDINVLIKVNALLGVFAFMLLSARIRREYVPIYLFAGFLVASFFVSSFFVGRTGWRLLNPILFMASSLGAAMILLRGYVYSWGGYIVFYSLAGYFFILMLTGVDGYSALKYCSFNGVSMVMLIACISLYIILINENKKIDLKPALFTLVISIWAIGRSGIASSFVLLLGLLFVMFRAKPRYIFYVIIFLFLTYYLTSATNYLFFSNAINHYFERSVEGGDSARLAMWTNYFNNLDLSRVIFGVNVVEDPWPEGEINEYNYHNSFINLHSQTGFMGLVTLALIIFALFKFYRTNKVFFFLLLALILRSSTDLFVFFGRFDFIPFFFIFYYLHEKTRHFQRVAPGRAAKDCP